MKDGRVWPSEADKAPIITRFWVQNTPLIHEEGDLQTPGISNVVVTESPKGVEERLREQFFVYKYINIGRQALQKVLVGGKNEI